MIKALLNKYFQSSSDAGFQLDLGLSDYVLYRYLIRRFVHLLRFNIHRLLSLRKTSIAFIGNGVSVDSYRDLCIGTNSRIEAYCIVGAFGRKGLTIGKNSSIGAFSRIVVSSGFQNIGEYINIGDQVGIGAYANIGGSGGVSIGNDTIIGPYFSAHPENHNFSLIETPIRLQGTTRSEIRIGEDCWLGAKVTVLAGVTIGKGSVIAAGSLVTKDIPEYSVALGSPAKVVRRRK